jgi:hypothetical protein
LKVSVGLGTIVGYLLTTVGAAATAWASAEGPASHISPGLLAILTIVSGLGTTLGRQYQGGKALEGVPPTALELPTDAQELEAPPPPPASVLASVPAPTPPA